jgi:hypothetical protein
VGPKELWGSDLLDAQALYHFQIVHIDWIDGKVQSRA